MARSPEILSVVDDIPGLRTFIFSLHKCQYKAFMRALVDMHAYTHGSFAFKSIQNIDRSTWRPLFRVIASCVRTSVSW